MIQEVQEGLESPGDCAWEGSLSVLPAMEADDSPTPGQSRGREWYNFACDVCGAKALFSSLLRR